jgi:hypothetical protein
VTLRARTLRLAALAAAAIALAAPAAASASPTFYVNSRDDRPAAVSAERLYELADASARRWELRVAGETSAPPGVRDGTQAFGFSTDTNPDALGVTSVWTRTRYRVIKIRRCTRSGGRRVCRTSKRYRKVGEEVVEKDVQLNPFVTWQQGPVYPTRAEYDLESTILHELGHFANPLKDNHVRGCENTPMIASISPGEYWRDADDWLRLGCSASTGALKVARAGAELPLLVVEHRLPPLVER